MSSDTPDIDLPLVIEPENFARLVIKPNWLIIDLSQPASYQQGHVPGAIYVPPNALIHGEPPTPGKLPHAERLNALFAAIGLSDDTHIIVYDDEGGGWAGRFIWTLDIIGHKHYSYLNGGIHAWRLAGLPEEQTENIPNSRDSQVTIDTAQVIEAEDIMENLNELHIWDARSPAEYHGENVFAQRGGHIPGAINCEWTTLMDATLGYRIRQDAKSMLAKLGITGDKPIVTHCQTHHRSGFTYLVGKTLGFDIKAYHGSWSEWGNRSDTPIES